MQKNLKGSSDTKDDGVINNKKMCEDEDKMSERWSSTVRNTSRKGGRWILIGESIMGGGGMGEDVESSVR